MLCGGAGLVAAEARTAGDRRATHDDRDVPPDGLDEFLHAWAVVDASGFGELLAGHARGRTLCERFVSLAELMSAEVSRLEFDADVETALREAGRRGTGH